MFVVYNTRGMEARIPQDTFVFWGELREAAQLSTPRDTAVLWCADADTCFGASLLDSDVWRDAWGSTISGQWRVSLMPCGTESRCRMTLLKHVPRESFPPNRGPQWLMDRLHQK